MRPTVVLATAIFGGLAIGLSVYSIQKRRQCNLGERIPGGYAAGKKPWQFNPKEFMRGMKVEMEHTDDWCTAGEITMDHLVEDRSYYRKLLKAGL